MPKHIRHGIMDDIKQVATTTFDNAKEAINKATAKEGFHGRREEEPKVMFGLTKKQLMTAIIILIIFLVVAHYMGWIELPSFIADVLPRKAAPPSHLQYFFF